MLGNKLAMKHQETLEKIKTSAQEILKKSPPPKKALSYNDVYDLIYEISLNETIIKLQEDYLQKTLIEMEEIRNRYSTLYDFIPVGYFTLNHHGNILELNDTAANLLGIKKKELLNRNIARYLTPDSQEAFLLYHKKTLAETTLQTCEVKFFRRGSAIFYAQLNSKTMINSITNDKHIIVVVNEITDRKQKEMDLHQQQIDIASIDRTLSLEKLISVMAHELNQPLAVTSNYIHGCIQRIESGKYEPKEILHGLNKAAEQSYRASEIILRMKNFSCKGKLNFENVNLYNLICDAIALITYEVFDYPVTIENRAGKEPVIVRIDRIHIEQVILNLARNAIEAMRDANIEHPKLRIETNRININTVEICIIDNGPGISSESLHKLFNPNFTTKPYGIGLGLSISRHIIDAHGGQFFAEPNPSGGACFKFALAITKQAMSIA